MQPVHNIAQWLALDQTTKSAILQNLKVVDRLNKFLVEKNRGGHKVSDAPVTWVPCLDCGGKHGTHEGGKGWVPKTPRRPGIHPSQLPNPCLLKVYKEMEGQEGEEQIPPRMQMIFDLGSAFHRMMQHYGLKGAWGPKYELEVPITGEVQQIAAELMLEGSADAENFLEVRIPDGRLFEVGILHEYKTINMNGFKDLTRPKPAHKQQAQVYGVARDKPIVVYVYMNKNDQNLLDFPVAFDQQLWSMLRGKAQILVDAYERQQAPPGDVARHCNECAYIKNCEAVQAHIARGGKI